MKFIAIALIAATSAVTLRDPAGSAEARAESFGTSLKTVAEQQKFEKEHAAAHKEAMATWEQENQDHKNSVRMARHRQITEGNQYPDYAVYGDKGAKKE